MLLHERLCWKGHQKGEKGVKSGTRVRKVFWRGGGGVTPGGMPKVESGKKTTQSNNTGGRGKY